jgi:hypothetical protein
MAKWVADSTKSSPTVNVFSSLQEEIRKPRQTMNGTVEKKKGFAIFIR